MRGDANSSSSSETVNAAANAILAAGERRVQQVTVPRRRWGACFNIHWCFGSSHKHSKRINQAALVPEPILTPQDPRVSDNQSQLPPLTLPFTVPPSSPASFPTSEPPSSSQSPGGFLYLSTLPADATSPTGPTSIFAIGPYAYETQLVSPPVFSTFTTEPSTAPFTPPPEPVQFTTPSSPEVPFARLLSSSFDSKFKKGEAYEFHLYQLFPGSSPVGHLISPGSSSPFPDSDLHASQKHRSILDGNVPEIVLGSDERDASANEGNDGKSTGELHLRTESLAEMVRSKELKFRNSDGMVVIDEAVPPKNFAFFPMVQSGVS